MELWDIYDEQRKLTGRTMERGSAFGEGEYHLVIHVCIFNSSGELLIQQRQSFKEGWPNLWDVSIGGSALAGENSQTAAERETLEELGIKLELQGIRPRYTINFDHGFDDIYIIQKDIKIEDLQLQYDEVRDAKWASKEEILKMLKVGEFLPYYPGFIEWLFDSRKSYGFLAE